MARKRTAKHPQHADEADISREIPEEQEALEATEPENGGASISKAEAVRRGRAAGKESPDEGVAYIRERFGIEMAKPHWSAVRSQQRKKEGGAKIGRGRRTKAEAYVSPPNKPPAQGEGDLLAAMEAMKPLVAALGAEKVKRIADLLG